jgi:hypothetical protein
MLGGRFTIGSAQPLVSRRFRDQGPLQLNRVARQRGSGDGEVVVGSR